MYEADLFEKEKIEKIFLENEIEAVIHFAGLKAVGESVKNHFGIIIIIFSVQSYYVR